MKVGDLVLLRGSLWSSYPREGEVGIILETGIKTGHAHAGEFSRVLWHDGTAFFHATKHLHVVNEGH